jgi:hypothetical protein
MKHVLGVALFFFGGSILAQTTFSLTGSLGTGFKSNVFNAPSVYIRPQGDTLTNDSLFVRDLLINAAFNADLKWQRKRHYFSWKTDFEIDRYAKIKQANSTEVDSWLRYNRKNKREKINPSAFVRLRSSQRLGLNVLGSELLTPFSFREGALGGSLNVNAAASYSFVTELSYSFKDFDACLGCGLNNESVSLTQREWELGLQHEFILDRKERRKKLIISTRWRDRRYFDWLNYDLLDPNRTSADSEPFLPFDPSVEYTARQWRFFITEFSYTLPVSKILVIKPQLEFTRRFDVSNGDFGSRQWSTDLIALLKTDDWSGRLRVGYTLRNYTDRLAEQDAGTPYPLLTYRYFRTTLQVERVIGKNFSLWASTGYTSRQSNTDLLTTRVRRSYSNTDFLLGVKASLDGKRSARDKSKK